jgi:DNA repair photolyase
MKNIYSRFTRLVTVPNLNMKTLSDNLGSGNYIFVGSSCDMFANNIPNEWIYMVVKRTRLFENNRYLFQTKNPERFTSPLFGLSAKNNILCTTIETDQHLSAIMRRAPSPFARAKYLTEMKERGFKTMVTIDPVMDFDLNNMLFMLKKISPEQVNIGSDSGHNHLPEPPKGKIMDLITELEKFTKVIQKENLRRLIA